MTEAADVVRLGARDMVDDLRETHLRAVAYQCMVDGIALRLQIERAGRDIANQRGDGAESTRRSEAIEELTELRRRVMSVSALEWPVLP